MTTQLTQWLSDLLFVLRVAALVRSSHETNIFMPYELGLGLILGLVVHNVLKRLFKLTHKINSSVRQTYQYVYVFLVIGLLRRLSFNVKYRYKSVLAKLEAELIG